MKLAATLLLALAPAWAQLAKPAPKHPPVLLPNLFNLEKTFDGQLRAVSLNDPIDLLGTTRGIYLDGYGAVFTAELSLIVTPGLSPFHQTITEQEKALVHERKLSRLPLLKRLMTDMIRNSVPVLATLPDNEHIVISVKLLYLPWENTQGLPGTIMMKATRQGALAGQIQTEEQ